MAKQIEEKELKDIIPVSLTTAANRLGCCVKVFEKAANDLNEAQEAFNKEMEDFMQESNKQAQEEV